MRKVISVLVFCLSFVVDVRGQTPMYIAWDYPNDLIAEVSEFQVKVDTGAYVSAGIPTPETLADTPTNHKSYRWLLPTLTAGGNHTVSVRACNSTECSWEPSIVFKLIGPPTNLRIKR